MGKPGQERTVIVSLWSAGSCGRKQLAGILRYINAGHPWNIRIIIAGAIGVSRRLADLRFAELTGRTIRRALEDRRLREVQRRLGETDLPIAKVTRLCGYQNDLWVKYVFRRRFGMSMSEWRERAPRLTP